MTGNAGGKFSSPSNSIYVGTLTGPGSASCAGFYCTYSFGGSSSQSFTGADLAIFKGSGTLTYTDASSVSPGFLQYDYFRGTTRATVAYFTGAPEPVSLAILEPAE